MTEQQIARAVMRARYQKFFCLHNFTPAQWWECDVFEVSAAGYFREYEIKTSRVDFFRDSDKQNPATQVWKHTQLQDGNPFGPRQFFYVMPPELLLVADDMPDWAGLMYTNNSNYPYVVKDAPFLHRVKFDEERMKPARDACYWRMHRMIQKYRE